MRLSRIRRILQVEEGVIHRGRRPRWITISEICRILHFLRKPNSIIALLFIQNIFKLLKERMSFTFIKLLNLLLAIFRLTKIPVTQSHPQFFFGQRFKHLQQFVEQQLVMVNYACGFNQSETGKLF